MALVKSAWQMRSHPTDTDARHPPFKAPLKISPGDKSRYMKFGVAQDYERTL